MARSINRVQLLGNLGHSPDLKATQDGTPVANFSVATSESWKGKDGNKQETVEWHRIVCWRKLAEIAGQYLHKGSKVYVDGKLQTRSWEKDGVKHFTTEIVATEIVMLDSRQNNGDPGPQEPPVQRQTRAEESDRQDAPDNDQIFGEDGLPF
jgi:single-strand DNA-binding protein